MAVQREKPYPGTNFVVDLGTGEVTSTDAGLTEVLFPEARLEVLEYRNGNDRDNEAHKLQTVTHYGSLVLRRPVIGSLSWYSWWNSARSSGQGAQRSVTVSLLSEDHSETVLTWKFRGACPANYQFSPLNALGTTPLMETLELSFDHMEME